jgi:uncharacterized protein (TIGR04551 family)
MKRAALATKGAVLGAVMLSAPAAHAVDGFTDTGEDLVPRDKFDYRIDGYFRVRGEMLNDLDLDRGLTPSGQPLFPVDLANPSNKTLYYWDMRLRTDLSVYAPGGTMAVKARIDVLDNVTLGSDAAGIPSASTRYEQGPRTFRIKWAYGEVLTPIGLFAAGRMGNNWGMGMLANSGDCLDCDTGDAADRLAWIAPMFGHILALAYDFSATEVTAPVAGGLTYVDVEPSADVRTVTAAFLRYHDDLALARRRRAGKTSLEYGAYVSHRWQQYDVPATYLPTDQAVPITASQVMFRGYNATAFDVWARVTSRFLHVEAEGAYLNATADQASLVPGALYNEPVTSNQFGAALQSEIAEPDGVVGGGLDVGFASGDNSPGFGAFVPIGAPLAKPGDLTGAKADPPYDTHVDNFQFSPDFHIDRILFREIIGTVTGAGYLRPHARWTFARLGNGGFQADIAGVASMAAYAISTPGGKLPLGVEIDPTLGYSNGDGFFLALEYGILFPLAGLDNPVEHLDAKPAQLARVRINYVF